MSDKKHPFEQAIRAHMPITSDDGLDAAVLECKRICSIELLETVIGITSLLMLLIDSNVDIKPQLQSAYESANEKLEKLK
jgi:hypothetical protein